MGCPCPHEAEVERLQTARREDSVAANRALMKRARELAGIWMDRLEADYWLLYQIAQDRGALEGVDVEEIERAYRTMRENNANIRANALRPIMCWEPEKTTGIPIKPGALDKDK